LMPPPLQARASLSRSVEGGCDRGAVAENVGGARGVGRMRCSISSPFSPRCRCGFPSCGGRRQYGSWLVSFPKAALTAVHFCGHCMPASRAEGRHFIPSCAHALVRHGLGVTSPVIPGVERPEEWEAHCAAMLESLAPVDYLETFLAERVALA